MFYLTIGFIVGFIFGLGLALELQKKSVSDSVSVHTNLVPDHEHLKCEYGGTGGVPLIKNDSIQLTVDNIIEAERKDRIDTWNKILNS